MEHAGQKTIAIVDDDSYISGMLKEVLQKEGYAVLCAYSGTEALLLLERQRPDLILLDLMLPGLTGEEILPKLSGIPVIVVSAKVDVQDKVKLLLAGAVDYLTKPFAIKELLARIAVQLRDGAATGLAPVLRFADLQLDTASHLLTVSDEEVKLTKTEYALLKLLLQNPNQAIAKSVILDRISMDTPDCTDSSLKQHISNLRHKLRLHNSQADVAAVWGIGFRLTTHSDASSASNVG